MYIDIKYECHIFMIPKLWFMRVMDLLYLDKMIKTSLFSLTGMMAFGFGELSHDNRIFQTSDLLQWSNGLPSGNLT